MRLSEASLVFTISLLINQDGVVPFNLFKWNNAAYYLGQKSRINDFLKKNNIFISMNNYLLRSENILAILLLNKSQNMA